MRLIVFGIAAALLGCASAKSPAQISSITIYSIYFNTRTEMAYTAPFLIAARHAVKAVIHDKDTINQIMSEIAAMEKGTQFKAGFDARLVALLEFADGHVDTLGLGRHRAVLNSRIYGFNAKLARIISKSLPEDHRNEIEVAAREYD